MRVHLRAFRRALVCASCSSKMILHSCLCVFVCVTATTYHARMCVWVLQVLAGITVGVQITVDPAFPRNAGSSGRYPAVRSGDRVYCSSKHLYDVMQSSHRMVSERFFGILCSRFRVLRGTYECAGEGWELRMSRMIRVCALLHNLCMDHDAASVDDVFMDLDGDADDMNANADSDDEQAQEQHAAAQGIRRAAAPAPLAATPAEQAAGIRSAVTEYLARRYELNLRQKLRPGDKPSRKMSYRLKSA